MSITKPTPILMAGQFLSGLLLTLYVGLAFADTDTTLNGGAIANGSAASSATSALAMAKSIGALFETLTLIFGLYYVLKSIFMYSRIVSGKSMGQDNLGGVASHFLAGTLAYYSRAFFITVHNTVPMIPDFGKLIYDAELMKSLMS